MAERVEESVHPDRTSTAEVSTAGVSEAGSRGAGLADPVSPTVGVPLERPSIAERVADFLRDRITDGRYKPGDRLSENLIVDELKTSRNTVREAFLLLIHERLLVREPYRGVEVRRLSVGDVVDLYRVRRVIECGAVAGLKPGLTGLDRLAAAIAEGEAAERVADWQALGTANIHFHQAVVGLAGSPRLAELMRGILAELRLVFHVMADPRRFYEPYLVRNRQILARLETGDGPGAAELLAAYLSDAERQLVDEFGRLATN